MTDILNRLRKGDVVAVQIEHSSTASDFKTSRYTRFVLATVAKASRDGLAQRVIMAGQTHSLEVARLGKVFTLPEHQKSAKRLVEATEYPGKEFETVESLKLAILTPDYSCGAPQAPHVPFVDVTTETVGDVTTTLSRAIRVF